MNQWNPHFVSESPMLAHLRRLAPSIAGWPDCSLVEKLLETAGVRNASGMRIRAVRPGNEGGYELRIYERGELEFRERNWHDLFNALTWMVFPRAKAALNARHHASLTREGLPSALGRGSVRDALTLFDESGVIVVSPDPGLLQMIRGFRWKPLFWDHRNDVVSSMHFAVFGHALCEKAMAPYRGMTGHGLLLDVDSTFFGLSDAEKIGFIDQQLACRIADQGFLTTPDALSPVPVLGVPGWHDGNQCAEFYDDQGYFRPGRRGRLPAMQDVTGSTR